MTPFRLRYADRIAALFLVAIAFLCVVSLSFFFRAQSFFVKRYEYTTFFEDGAGVAPETPVKISGIEVGKVRRVSLTDDNRVRVVFEVLEDFAPRIHADPQGYPCETPPAGKPGCGSRVSVNLPAGLGAFLPGSGLSLSVGDARNPTLPPGAVVPTIKAKGLQDFLEDLQKEGVVQNAQTLLAQVTELVTRLNDAQGPLWKTLGHVEAVTRDVQEGKGLVGEALRDDSALRRQVNQSLARLDRTLTHLEESAAHAALLLRDVEGKRPELVGMIDALQGAATDVQVASADLRKVAQAADGIAPELRATVDNLDGRIDDLGDILRGLKRSWPLSMVVETPPPPTTAPSPDAAASP